MITCQDCLRSFYDTPSKKRYCLAKGIVIKDKDKICQEYRGVKEATCYECYQAVFLMDEAGDIYCREVNHRIDKETAEKPKKCSREE